jgi:hypothetical protein
MNRGAKQHWLRGCAWALLVISAVALVLILSTAICLSAGHSFDHITLALPFFFVFWFLATPLSDWLGASEFSFAPQAQLSVSLTRGPPA